MVTQKLTKRMAAAQLRLLSILAVELRPNGIQQLQIRLLRPLFQRFDKCPAEGSTRLSVLERIGPAEEKRG
jgi:hypothetical protein